MSIVEVVRKTTTVVEVGHPGVQGPPGTGGGGGYSVPGVNGGGGGYATTGGFPGGGLGQNSAPSLVSYGLIIVEW